MLSSNRFVAPRVRFFQPALNHRQTPPTRGATGLFPKGKMDAAIQAFVDLLPSNLRKTAAGAGAPSVWSQAADPAGWSVPIPAALLSLSALGGALTAQQRGDPLDDFTRGATKGLGTAGGGILGFQAAKALGSDSMPIQLTSGALGAILGHLATARALRAVGLDNDREKQSCLPELEKQAAVSIEELLAVKAESDRRNWLAKHRLLRQLIRRDPKGFGIDSEDKGLVGITHPQTGFRIHLPANALPADVQLAQISKQGV